MPVSSDPHPQTVDSTRIKDRQIALLASQSSTGLLASAISACVFAYFVLPYTGKTELSVWLAVLLAITALRYAHVRHYQRAHSDIDRGAWSRAFIAGTGVSGLAWGLAGIVLLPAEPLVHQAFLLLLIGGLAAGTLSVYAALTHAGNAFMLPALLLPAAYMASHGDGMHITMATMITVFVIVMLIASRRMESTIVESLRSGLERQDLAMHLEALNEELTQEVHEREHAEQQARESEERFRTLAEGTFEGILVHRNGVTVDVNEKLATMLGRDANELIGKTVFELTNPAFHDMIRHRLAERTAETTELEVRRGDGSTFHAEIRAQDLPYKGETVRVVAVRDLSERKEAEQKLRASEEQLRTLLSNMQDTVYRTNTGGEVIWVSPSVTELLGYSVQETLGRSMSSFYVDADGREKFLSALQRGQGSVQNYEAALQCKDGSIIWVSTNAHYYYDEQGKVAGIEGTTRDITALRHAREALFHEKERALVTLESIGDGVITTDMHGYVESLNPIAETLTGWSSLAAQGQPLTEVFRVIREANGESAHEMLDIDAVDTPARSPGYEPVVLHHRHEGESSVVFTASSIRNRHGEALGRVVVFRDISELRRMERRLSHQATHDSLTGLINRYEFEQRLEILLEDAAHTGNEHALCYVDLDQFKVVNDTCGHVAGDELLKRLTGHLQTKVRESDTLARLGGDEFGILLERCAAYKAQEIADHLRATVRAFRFPWQEKVFEVGASIGVVPLTRETGSVVDALSAADSACYVAKDEGGDRIHTYKIDDTALAKRQGEMHWLQRTKNALEHDRFILYTQPAAALSPHCRDWAYTEVLLRMVTESGEVVGPMPFLPAAERYHLMPEIDRWVLRATLEQILAPACCDRPYSGVFAVNLSGQSVCQDTFLDYTMGLINDAGINPRNLCFEITETAAITNLSYAASFIAALKEMGCSFALDDFGSGLSSFGYLKNLPVDFLKIDGTFVRGMVDDQVDYAMVETINQIGHLMGKKTIAEYVENSDIAGSLETIGVDYAQGYHIQRPAACTPLDPIVK